MIITDTFSNLFSNIQNGYLKKKDKIQNIQSKQIILLLNLFLQKGIIRSYKIDPHNQKLSIYLKYSFLSKKPVIQKIQRISKPGRRVYTKKKNLLKNKEWFILSTTLGYMDNYDAYEKGLGGEVICKIQ